MIVAIKQENKRPNLKTNLAKNIAAINPNISSVEDAVPISAGPTSLSINIAGKETTLIPAAIDEIKKLMKR